MELSDRGDEEDGYEEEDTRDCEKRGRSQASRLTTGVDATTRKKKQPQNINNVILGNICQGKIFRPGFLQGV